MPNNRHIQIPDSELRWQFSRSSGPGGQHVNTSDTRVELRWSLPQTTVLSDNERARAQQVLSNRLDDDGFISITDATTRSQFRNRQSAKQRLEKLVSAAIVPPKNRRPARPSRSSIKAMSERKRQRSELKKLRRPPV